MPTAERHAPPPAVRHGALAAVALYTVLTLLMTWPLARGIARDMPGDLGDPVFETWVIAWDASHLGRGLWNANIFYPHPLTLAYSESLLPQALGILPIFGLTRNPVLCYNLLFLSTFALSGLGMFLLVRELTGSYAAGIVAGLAFAFAPYRFGALAHLQVLSSQWMPFVLLAFRRYFVTRRTVFLGAAASAWVVQNLSCLYYLVFFGPIVALYLGWELSVRRLWTDRRTLAAIGATCAAAALATVSVLLPYVEVRRLGIGARSLAETERFAADTYAYLTASPSLRLLGRALQTMPKDEGALFPGIAIVVLAAIGCLTRVAHTRRHSDSAAGAGGKVLVRLLAVLVCAATLVIGALMFGYTLHLPGIKVTSVARAVLFDAAAAFALLGVSPQVRRRVASWVGSPVGVFGVVVLFAALMSLGPDVHARGRIVADPSLYAFFFRYVPGFDAVRVPARFGMIVAFGLAVLAGFGVQALERRAGAAATVIAALLIVGESFAAPIPMNDAGGPYTQPGLAPLPPTLDLDENSRAAYAFVSTLHPPAVLLELPAGEPAMDIRYMFNSIHRWTPLVNGYSAVQPEAYAFLAQRLQDVSSRPDRAWHALRESGASYVLVHEALYADREGPRIADWLQSNGGVPVATFGQERIFRVR